MTTQGEQGTRLLDLFPSRDAGPFGRRLKQARGARIPVTIITGFLGAGKTTLLRRFLATPEGEGTAVVVNEFGNVGIDDALLRSSSDQITLLGNGCLCCTTRTDLQVTLRTLVAERDHGKVLPFRRIVIETSGLADPGPILQTLATVIDAASGPRTLDWAAEARKQVILADRLIVSKTDIADSGVVDRLKQQLRLLNPRADIHTAIEGALDARVLIAPGEPACGYVAEAAHSDGIASFVIMQNDPLPWNAFARAMETLITLRGPDLLRVKGFLNVEGCRGPVVVQIVQHLSHPPVELAAWPGEPRATRLVFITRHILERQG